MKKIFSLLLLSVFALGIQSCKKDVATDHVLLRVENNTSMDFENVTTSSTDFGNISANSKTAYKSLEQIVEEPSVFMESDNETFVCGRLYIDYIGYIKNGKYTLQIYPDAAAYGGYNCKYIKE